LWQSNIVQYAIASPGPLDRHASGLHLSCVQPGGVHGVASHAPLMQTPLAQSMLVEHEHFPLVHVFVEQSLFLAQDTPSPQSPTVHLAPGAQVGLGLHMLPPHCV
jgi:hypothetical protein